MRLELFFTKNCKYNTTRFVFSPYDGISFPNTVNITPVTFYNMSCSKTKN